MYNLLKRYLLLLSCLTSIRFGSLSLGCLTLELLDPDRLRIPWLRYRCYFSTLLMWFCLKCTKYIVVCMNRLQCNQNAVPPRRLDYDHLIIISCSPNILEILIIDNNYGNSVLVKYKLQNTKYKTYTIIWNTVCQTDSS
jgi:hypothetical protein